MYEIHPERYDVQGVSYFMLYILQKRGFHPVERVKPGICFFKLFPPVRVHTDMQHDDRQQQCARYDYAPDHVDGNARFRADGPHCVRPKQGNHADADIYQKLGSYRNDPIPSVE
jgi:hypothetical protein